MLRDVTKTKPSHYRTTSKAAAPPKLDIPTSAVGMQLAGEVKASKLPDVAKGRITREIAEYEGSHGHCTQTFLKKVRKQIRASET